MGGVSTRYLYDGADIIGTYNSSGTLLKRYVHGAGVDEPLVSFDNGADPETKTWLLADERGSVIAGTAASGLASFVNSYDEYGQPGPNNAGPFQYTGQVWLPFASVYHYKARAYDPALGRFLQTDPILFDGGMNLHGYVANACDYGPRSWLRETGAERVFLRREKGKAQENKRAQILIPPRKFSRIILPS
ncbi:MAG TPA: RHS repeat-associated core domain-containing protein [Caulobacterales bacterium]|nr:RHS repeat-associated core domain-containing protein [Caulobacterales bacterium]